MHLNNFHILFSATTPGAGQKARAAEPSSASGNDRPVGYVLQDGIAVSNLLEVRL